MKLHHRRLRARRQVGKVFRSSCRRRDVVLPDARSIARTQAALPFTSSTASAMAITRQFQDEEDTPDSSLSASSPPDVDGTRLYVYEANNQVQYFRLSPADATSDDITFLTAKDAPGGLALDVYGQIRARSRLATGLESRKTGNGGYHVYAGWVSDTANDGVTPVPVFTVGPRGQVEITPNAAATALSVAPTVGPRIAGNYGIFAKMPSDTQQAAISAYQAGTTSGAYGLRVEMASGASAHGIYVKQGGSGDIIRDSGGNFRVLSTGAIDLAALTTAVSTVPWLRAQTAFAIPATVGTPTPGRTFPQRADISLSMTWAIFGSTAVSPATRCKNTS